MATNTLKSIKPFYNPTPAEFIKEQMEVRDWTQEDLADVLGYSVQTVIKLLKNRSSITIDVAKALGKAFNQTPQYWLNLDNIYRLHLRVDTLADEEVAIRSKLYASLPINEMVKRGWIQKSSLLESLVSFFKCKKPEDILESKVSELVYRKSEVFEERFDHNAASCWFQMAKNVSERMSVCAFDMAKLEALSKQLYTYTAQNNIAQFLSDLNGCGVRFFVLPHLSKTYIDGAAFYLNSTPTIVYTARYKRLDNFWFVMAHEIGHIILQHFNAKMRFIIEYNAGTEGNEMEKEANEAAGQMLQHKTILDTLGRVDYLTSLQITEAAKAIGVHPCIVVGALSRVKDSYYKRLQEFNEDIFTLIPDAYFIEKQL
jgi:HTH-type transcriptional regulator / antitoxin HigA